MKQTHETYMKMARLAREDAYHFERRAEEEHEEADKWEARANKVWPLFGPPKPTSKIDRALAEAYEPAMRAGLFSKDMWRFPDGVTPPTGMVRLFPKDKT